MKKIVKFLLHVLRGVGLTLLTIFLVIISPWAWPIYAGIVIFRPYILPRVLTLRIW